MPDGVTYSRIRSEPDRTSCTEYPFFVVVAPGCAASALLSDRIDSAGSPSAA